MDSLVVVIFIIAVLLLLLSFISLLGSVVFVFVMKMTSLNSRRFVGCVNHTESYGHLFEVSQVILDPSSILLFLIAPGAYHF